MPGPTPGTLAFWAVALLAIGACAVNAAGLGVEIQVLHFNDNHARFTPTDAQYGSLCDDPGAVACFGGFARQATAIKAAKAAALQRGVPSLVLHAGDQFTGTSWDTVYTAEGVQVAPDMLQELGVQAMTLGNHEFDNGIEILAQFIGNCSFPVLACNLDTSREPRLTGLVQPYTVIELPKSGVKVGVVGLVTTTTPETSQPGPTLGFLPYADTLPGCVEAARAEGAQYIILLTHIGYEEDLQLAATSTAAGVDLIIGGHSHTLLYGPSQPGAPQQAGTPPPVLLSPPTEEANGALGPYPTWVQQQGGNRSIPVVQAGWASRYLGVLNTTWDDAGLVSASGAPLLLGGANSTNAVPDHPIVAAMIADLSGPVAEFGSEVVGENVVFLDGDRAAVRNKGTNLGAFMCSSLFYHAEESTALLQEGLAAVCIVNSGGIRESVKVGPVTRADFSDVSPFDSSFVVQTVDAPTVLAALNSGVSMWTGDDSASGQFPQIGGMRMGFNSSLPATSRVVNVVLLVNGSEVPLQGYAGTILLLTNAFVAAGGDSYDMLVPFPITYDSSLPLSTLMSDYFKTISPALVTSDGRIDQCALPGPSDRPLCIPPGGEVPPPVPEAADVPASAPAPVPGQPASTPTPAPSSGGEVGKSIQALLVVWSLVLAAACVL